MIGDDIRIVVVEIRDGVARIGIEAPQEYPIWRKEIYDEKQQAENNEEAEV